MAKVGIVDSGCGGLSVLKEIRQALPEGRFIYYADNANCPYGDKSPEFIISRMHDVTDLMLSKGVQVLVVACNTATSAAIADLRGSYSIPFVGMEPAVKPAALGTRSGVIGVLATAGTLRGSKYLKAKGRFEEEVRIVEKAGEGFVELVESGILDGPRAEETVSRSLLPLLEEGADTVVLGCTHYPFLLPVMEKVAAECAGEGKVRFIDPAPAVARRLLQVLGENGIPFADPEPGLELMSSGEGTALERILSLW